MAKLCPVFNSSGGLAQPLPDQQYILVGGIANGGLGHVGHFPHAMIGAKWDSASGMFVVYSVGIDWEVYYKELFPLELYAASNGCCWMLMP